MGTNFIERLLNSNPEIKVGIQEFLIVQKECSSRFTPLDFGVYTKDVYLQSYNAAIQSHVYYKWLGNQKVSSFEDIPIFGKNDFREFGEALSSIHKGQVWKKSTSGTSGKPLMTYFDTNFHVSLKFSSIYKVIRKLSLFDLNKTANRVLSFGITDNFDYGMIADISPFFQTHFFVQRKLDVNDPSTIDKCIEFIKTYEPLIIRSKPYLLELIADRLDAKTMKLNYSPVLFSSGCSIDKSTWDKCEFIFGAKLINLYGTTEIGVMAFQEDINGRFELLDSDIHVEVLVKDGTIGKSKEVGNIAVSSLRNAILPFYRYDTGDQGVISEGPRGFPRLLGRNLPIFWGISGKRLPSNSIAQVLMSISIEDFQVIQEKKGELIIQLPNPEIVNSDVRKLLNKVLDCRVLTVKAEGPIGSIDRFKSYVGA